MKLQCYGQTAYFHHQTDYVQPTVINGWKEHQSELMDVVRLEVGPITVAGDARSDSQGHCAKLWQLFHTGTTPEQSVGYPDGTGEMFYMILFILL